MQKHVDMGGWNPAEKNLVYTHLQQYTDEQKFRKGLTWIHNDKKHLITSGENTN